MIKQITAAKTPTKVMIDSFDQDLEGGFDVGKSCRVPELVNPGNGYAIDVWMQDANDVRSKVRWTIPTRIM
jgi:hypothetical protein